MTLMACYGEPYDPNSTPDYCPGAPLVIGDHQTIIGDTTKGTNEVSPSGDSPCRGRGPERVFEYDATESGRVDISIDTTADLEVYLMDGSCELSLGSGSGAHNQLGKYCATGTVQSLSAELKKGTYMVVVDSRTRAGAGPFTLHFQFTPDDAPDGGTLPDGGTSPDGGTP
jgi:hypothetical protein